MLVPLNRGELRWRGAMYYTIQEWAGFLKVSGRIVGTAVRRGV